MTGATAAGHTVTSKPGSISGVSLTAAIALGVAGSYFFILLPLITAGLIQSQHYPPSRAGIVAAAPLAGMFTASLGTAVLLSHLRARTGAIIALLIFIVANLVSATLLGSALELAAAQFAAGCAGVFLLALAFAFIGSSSSPDRYFALAIALQVGAGAIATLAVQPLARSHGVAAIFLTFAAVAAVAAPIALLLPNVKSWIGGTHKASSEPRSGGWLAGTAALGVQIAFGCGVMLIWSWVGEIGHVRGFSSGAVAQALTVSLLASIGGALSASAAPRRTPGMLWLALGTLVMMGATVLTATSTHLVPFFVGVVLFGVGWNFSPPFQLGIAARLDRGGRLVVLCIAAVKLGYSAGAALGGVLAETRLGSTANAIAACGCFIVALLAAGLADGQPGRTRKGPFRR